MIGVNGCFARTKIPTDATREDMLSLVDLYERTDGDSWTNNSGWLTERALGDWYGVTVSGGRVTQIDLDANGSSMSGDISDWTLPSSLTRLYLNDTSVSGDIGDWTLPSSLAYLYLTNTSVSGDISGWTLPSSLAYLYLNNTSVSGDISGWTLPSSLAYLYLYNTSVSGDIGDWTLPSSLAYLRLGRTSLSGDIGDWTLPSSLAYLLLHDTSVSGDISGWTLPSSLTFLHLYNTSVSGAPTFGGNAAASYQIQDCGLSSTDVDAWLENIYDNRSNFTNAAPVIDISGTNAAPSGAYQDGDPPTTGKEYAYELENDPETEGFNTWDITYS